MIREAIREAVQLAAGDKREASRRFEKWLKAGGKERALAFFAEIRPHCPDDDEAEHGNRKGDLGDRRRRGAGSGGTPGEA
jgi:hypothetical protein